MAGNAGLAGAGCRHGQRLAGARKGQKYEERNEREMRKRHAKTTGMEAAVVNLLE